VSQVVNSLSATDPSPPIAFAGPVADSVCNHRFGDYRRSGNNGIVVETTQRAIG
jgi:hypothetical protein